MSFRKTLLATIIANSLAPPAINAATITVNSLADTENGQCTLRAALDSFSRNSYNLPPNPDCSFSGTFGTNDRINFSNRSGTIVLQQGSLYVGGSLYLNPESADITIDASKITQTPIFAGGPGEGPTINGLTITGGRNSGIKIFSGALTLKNSQVSGNSGFAAGGIFLYIGSLKLENSTISNNTSTVSVANNTGDGGGIRVSQGTLTLNKSTISGNSASSGGGIAASYNSVVTMENSTISGNSAADYGGGLVAERTDISIVSSTISNNSSGIGNSGGLALALSELTLENSIIANSQGADCYALVSAVTADTFNIIEDGSCNTQARTGDPQLGPLQDNGGPSKTHAIRQTSIAINSGKNLLCREVDQRDRLRFDGKCDVGAFELGAIVRNEKALLPIGALMLLLDK